MSRVSRVSRARVLAPAVLALSLLAAGCGDGEDGTGPASPAPAATAPTEAAPQPSASETPSEPAFDGTLIQVTIKGGKVTPAPSTHKIAKGSKVRIEVTSDTADELHVHGYDNTADLKPGETAVVELTATQSGRFEVETHDSGLVLFNLQVS